MAYPFDSDNFPYGGVFNENYTAAAALALSVEQATATRGVYDYYYWWCRWYFSWSWWYRWVSHFTLDSAYSASPGSSTLAEMVVLLAVLLVMEPEAVELQVTAGAGGDAGSGAAANRWCWWRRWRFY